MIDVAYDLDHFKDEAISLTREIRRVQELQLAQSEFTRTFNVPASAKNNERFSNYGLIDSDEGFDPHQAIAAYWTIDTLLKFEGSLEVNGVTYKNGEPYSYKITFYGETRGLASIFGEDTLQDIDWSDFNHNKTYDNIVDSWSQTLVSGDVHYPWIALKRDWILAPPSLVDSQNIRNSFSGITADELRPGIRLGRMLQVIFDNYDLGLTTPFDSQTDLYVQPNNREIQEASLEELSENTVVAEVTSQTLTGVTAPGELLDFLEVIDVQNHWNDTTHRFTAFNTGGYVFQLTGTLPESPGNNSNLSRFFIGYVNGSSTTEGNFVGGNYDGPGSFNVQLSGLWNLQQGDTLEFRIVTFNHNGTSALSVQNLNLELTTFPLSTYGNTVDVGANMPNIKVTDFLKSVMKSFNLIVTPDGTDSYALQTYADWYADGETRDWSKFVKLDDLVYDKPQVFKQLRFKHKDSESRANEVFNQIAGRPYGSTRFEPEVDFGNDVLETESPFTVFPPSAMSQFDADGNELSPALINCYRSINREGEPVVEDFILYYHQGIGFLPGGYYLQDGENLGFNTYALTGIFPRIGTESEFPSENASDSVTYSLETPITGQAAQNTLYSMYWQKYIREMYDPRTRICTAEFYLPIDEYIQFKLNNSIFVEGHLYTIESMTYNFQTNFAKCRLRTFYPSSEKTILVGVDQTGKASFSGETPNQKKLNELNLYGINGSYFLPRFRVNPSRFTKLDLQIDTQLINQNFLKIDP